MGRHSTGPDPEGRDRLESGLLKIMPEAWCFWFSRIIDVASGIHGVVEVLKVRRWQVGYPEIGRGL